MGKNKILPPFLWPLIYLEFLMFNMKIEYLFVKFVVIYQLQKNENKYLLFIHNNPSFFI